MTNATDMLVSTTIGVSEAEYDEYDQDDEFDQHDEESEIEHVLHKHLVDHEISKNLELILIGVAVFLIIALMFTEKRKLLCKKFFNGRFALIVPINFLESRRKRNAYLALYALISLEILDKVTKTQTSKNTPYLKVFFKLFSMALISIKYLPSLRCIYITSLTNYVIGLLYTSFVIAVAIIRKTPNPELDMELLIGDLIFRTIIEIIAGVYILYWFSRGIYKLLKYGPKDIHLGKCDTEFVKNLLTKHKRLNQKMLTFGKKTKMSISKNWFRDHVYYNVPGFKYSLTILLSGTIGIICVSKIAITLLYTSIKKFVDTYEFLVELKEAAEKETFKIPNFVKMIIAKLNNEELDTVDENDLISFQDVFRTQLIVILVSTLLGVVIAYILSFVLVCRLLVNYRDNILNLSLRTTEKQILNVSTMSNISLVVSGIHFLGYQVAYLISGFTIQTGFFTFLSFMMIEVVLFPVQFALKYFVKWIINLLIPIVISLIVIKRTQYLLVRFVFLQDRGKTLAFNNRRGFFIMTYVIVFYNVFTGFFSCLLRIIKSTFIGVVLLPRLDCSLFPSWLAKYDSGFKAYSCLLHLESLQSNPILRTFAFILLKNISDKSDYGHFETFSAENIQICTSRATRYKTGLVARNRWFVAVTLIRNPILIYERLNFIKAANAGEENSANDKNQQTNYTLITEKESVI